MSGTEGVMAVSIEEWNAKTTENEFLRTEIARLQNDVVRELRKIDREEVEQLQVEIATLTTLLKAASYHVEGDGDGGAALLAKIRAALEPKP